MSAVQGSSSPSEAFSGFAVRSQGNCLANEVDCGATVKPFRACCPGTTTKCPSQDNVNCCPTATNCTASLLDDPQCANRRWDLYYNDGYFCCRPDYIGFGVGTQSVGCAKPGDSFDNGETLLKIVSRGGDQVRSSSTSSSSSSSTTSSLTKSTDTTSSSVTSSHTTLGRPSLETSLTCDGTTSCERESTTPKSNTGAIAGGVVGGLAGLAIILAIVWIVLRRKRAAAAGYYLPSGTIEKEAPEYRSELPAHSVHPRPHGASELE